ncbi:MAG: hypothetical protein UZ17_ACD001001530 [Acidobacteria bacterium OLB17]|nr:MAG: hypothetical protein UZ17_ACD001001530 [Acidobacteria bacterium OLB17]MCZ2391333.1 hypothetical protein [Acidobacteriota bacterium]
MPRNGITLYRCVLEQARVSRRLQQKDRNGLHIRPQRTPGDLSITERMQGGDRQAEILAEWMREMHFPKPHRRRRGSPRRRVHSRWIVLKPIDTQS